LPLANRTLVSCSNITGGTDADYCTDSTGSGGSFNDTFASTYIVSSVDSQGDFTDIQSAINALTTSGGLVHVKNGTYTITTPINISKNFIVLEGEGPGTIISFSGTTLPIAVQTTTAVNGVQIRDLRIDNTDTDGDTGLAMNLTLSAVGKFSNLWISDVNRGIFMNKTGTHYNTIENLRIDVGGPGAYGIYIGNIANDNSIFRTRIATDNNATGVFIDAHKSTLYDVNVETGARIGIEVGPTGHDTLISGAYLEANIVNLKINSGVEGVTVIGGFIADATTSNIDDTSGTTTWINPRVQYNPMGINTSFNVSASFYFGDGSRLTGISGGNSTFNESRTDILYASIIYNHNQTLPAQVYANSNFNYSSFILNITSADCGSGLLVIGVQLNGTVLCTTDATGSGSFNTDQFNSNLNKSANVTFGSVNTSIIYIAKNLSIKDVDGSTLIFFENNTGTNADLKFLGGDLAGIHFGTSSSVYFDGITGCEDDNEKLETDVNGFVSCQTFPVSTVNGTFNQTLTDLRYVSKTGDNMTGDLQFNNVDVYFNGSSADIKSSTDLDFYPWNQNTISARISNDSFASVTWQALGSNFFVFQDRVNVTAGLDFCINGGSCLGTISVFGYNQTAPAQSYADNNFLKLTGGELIGNTNISSGTNITVNNSSTIYYGSENQVSSGWNGTCYVIIGPTTKSSFC